MKKIVLSTILASTILLGNTNVKENITSNFEKLEQKLQIVEKENLYLKEVKEKKQFFVELKELTNNILKTNISLFEQYLFKESTKNFNSYNELLSESYSIFSFGVKALSKIKKTENNNSVKKEIQTIIELTKQIKIKIKTLQKKANIINEFNMVFNTIKKDIQEKFNLEIVSFWIPTIELNENGVALFVKDLDFEKLSDDKYSELMDIEDYILKTYSNKKFTSIIIS